MTESLLTESELSDLIRVTVATVRAWRWRGGGPAFIRVGRCVRYDPRAVRAWLDGRTRVSTSDTGPADAA